MPGRATEHLIFRLRLESSALVIANYSIKHFLTKQLLVLRHITEYVLCQRLLYARLVAVSPRSECPDAVGTRSGVMDPQKMAIKHPRLILAEGSSLDADSQ